MDRVHSFETMRRSKSGRFNTHVTIQGKQGDKIFCPQEFEIFLHQLSYPGAIGSIQTFRDGDLTRLKRHLMNLDFAESGEHQLIQISMSLKKINQNI